MAKKILVVDDNEIDIDSIKRKLKTLPAEITSAQDEQSALKALQEENFDLIISDFNLAATRASELVQKIKNIESLKNIPILVVSGLRPPDSQTLFIREHKIQLITKDDVQSDQFLNLVEKYLAFA